jgi:membrane-associated phospholipid phosphatase
MTRISVVFLLAVLASPPAAPADTIEQVGNVGAVALPISGGVVAAIQRDGKGTLQLAEAYATTMAVVYILKPAINRRRPDGGSQSFPSGHSASAFAGAAFLQRRYGWSYGVPAYALATFVAYSRVEAKRHWTSDVIAGGVIGIASNLVFTRRYRKLTVQPVPQARGAAVTIQLRW